MTTFMLNRRAILLGTAAMAGACPVMTGRILGIHRLS